MITYFVSYAHSRGYGSAEINLKNQISSWADIKLLTRMLTDNSPQLDSIVIINFIPLTISN